MFSIGCLIVAALIWLGQTVTGLDLIQFFRVNT